MQSRARLDNIDQGPFISGKIRLHFRTVSSGQCLREVFTSFKTYQQTDKESCEGDLGSSNR